MLKNFRNKKETVLGLDLCAKSINLSLGEKENEKVVFSVFESFHFEKDIVQNGDIADEVMIFDVLEQFFLKHSLKNVKIKLSICSTDVYLKKLSLPDVSEKELSLIILQEVEKSMPFSLDELYIDFEVVKSFVDPVDHAKKLDVVYVAAQKYIIDNYINLINKLDENLGTKAKIELSSVNISAFSVLNITLNEMENDSEAPFVLAFIDYENTDLMIVKEQMPVEISTVLSGLNELDKFPLVDNAEEDAAAFDQPTKTLSESICFEISGLVDTYLSQNSNESAPEKVIIFSRKKLSPDIEQEICNRVSIPVVFKESVESLACDEELKADMCEHFDFWVSSGVLLDSVDFFSINLLFDLSRKIKMYSRGMLSTQEKRALSVVYAIALVGFLIMFGMWGYFYTTYNKLSSKVEKLDKEYISLKSTLEKTYAQREGLKETKEVMRLKLLAKDQIKKELISWYSILGDISSIVPQKIKIKEIEKVFVNSKSAQKSINIKGQIDSIGKKDPLQYISFFTININENLPQSTKIHNASIKDLLYNENDQYYEFNITTDLKKD